MPARRPTAPPDAATGKADPSGPRQVTRFPCQSEHAALAMAEEIANRHDFGLPLALVADNYASLHQCLQEVFGAARQFHLEWRIRGDKACLATARSLDIKNALLSGLYLIRLLHKDWLSSTPVTSPESLAHVLPLFRNALALCEEQSEGVRFPIVGLHPALAHLSQQVGQSLQSLRAGQWQCTAEGQSYGRRHSVAQAPGGAAPQGGPVTAGPAVALSGPYAGLAAACRDLSQVLDRLQVVLTQGPAVAQAGPRGADAAPPPLPREAEPTGQPPVCADAAAAARLRQEQVDALQAALAPLLAEADRCETTAQAGGTPGCAAEAAWQCHSRAFAAWQTAAQAHHACAAALAAQAKALLFDPGAAEPAVDRLRQRIDTAAGRALEHATQAGRDTLTAFAQTCHAAIVRRDMPGGDPASLTGLEAHCLDLQRQWHAAPLRPRMPALEMPMAMFSAYAAACGVTEQEPDSAAAALRMAEDWRHAAHVSQRVAGSTRGDLAGNLGEFHQFCVQQRNHLLRAAVRMESATLATLHAQSVEALRPVLLRSRDVATAYDVLLTGGRLGDPLPDDWDRQAGAAAGPAQVPSAAAQADRSLFEKATALAKMIDQRHQQAIELPADAPELAAHELQLRLAVLRQTGLAARGAATAIDGFLELSAALDRAAPLGRPAIVRRHAEAVRQRAAELRWLLQKQDSLARPSLAPELRDLLACSKAGVRADQRLTDRLQMSLQTLERLLDLRGVANRTRRRFEQDKLAQLACPEISGHAHQEIATALQNDKNVQEQRLLAEHDKIDPAAWQIEKEHLDKAAASLQAKIGNDQALISAKLLLIWAEKTLDLIQPDKLRKAAEKIRDLGSKRSMRLEQLTGGLKDRAAASEHHGSYEAQIAVNHQIQRRLQELLARLEQTLAGGPSSAARRGKPSRPGRARHR